MDNQDYKILSGFLLLLFVCVGILAKSFTSDITNLKQTIQKTQTTQIKPDFETIYTNLTVYNGTQKECGKHYPIACSGVNINEMYNYKCCSVSKDVLKKYNLKMFDVIEINSNYQPINGKYTIIDKGTKKNIIEILVKKTNEFKLEFYLKNQQIIINN